MQTLDFVSGFHNYLEFSQPLSCLYQAMQTRKTFSMAELLYEGIDLIIIGPFKKFHSDRSHKFHIDNGHKESMSMWFTDVPSGNAESY